MKKIITLLLGMLLLTLGSSTVLAMESENMASDIGQSEFSSSTKSRNSI